MTYDRFPFSARREEMSSLRPRLDRALLAFDSKGNPEGQDLGELRGRAQVRRQPRGRGRRQDSPHHFSGCGEVVSRHSQAAREA